MLEIKPRSSARTACDFNDWATTPAPVCFFSHVLTDSGSASALVYNVLSEWMWRPPHPPNSFPASPLPRQVLRPSVTDTVQPYLSKELTALCASRSVIKAYKSGGSEETQGTLSSVLAMGGTHVHMSLGLYMECHI